MWEIARCYPTAAPPLRVRPGSQAISHSETLIEFDGTIQARKCFVIALLAELMKSRQPTKIVVVSIQIFGGLASGPLDLGLFEPGCDGADDACSHLVL